MAWSRGYSWLKTLCVCLALDAGLASVLRRHVRFAADGGEMAPAAVAVRVTRTDVKRTAFNIFNQEVQVLIEAISVPFPKIGVDFNRVLLFQTIEHGRALFGRQL